MKIKADKDLNLETFGSLLLQKIKNRWYASDENLNSCLKGANVFGTGKTQVDAAMDFVKKLIEIQSVVEKTVKNIDEIADNLKEK